MKKILSILTIISIFMMLPCAVFASENETMSNENTYVTYLDDGSYYITTITESVARSNKTATKSTTYNGADGTALWKVTVKGTFSYDGSSVSCTTASHTVNIYDSVWYTYSANSYTSSNKAIADFTMKKKLLGIVTSTRSVTLTLACDKNGNLS